MKDTYNLLGDGIVGVLRQLARLSDAELKPYASARALGRYVSERSLKGDAELDWDSAGERERLLREIVGDADRLLGEVRTVRGMLTEGSPEDQQLAQAAERLSQVLLQDIERDDEGARLRRGVARDRMPSVHDPEMRHGHKSAKKRFDGHKAQIAVDTESQLITAVAVVAGNAPDNAGALELVEESEGNTEAEASDTVADCAYGDGSTRQAFTDANRQLVAKVPVMRNQGRFPKTDFRIDLAAVSCICPAGQRGRARYSRPTAEAPQPMLRGFRYATEQCEACPLRPRCVRGRNGRTIAVHPQEELLQQARAFQASPAFAPYKRARQAAEHRIARLVQLGVRQARYFGRAKTHFQLLMAAAVANLTLLAGQAQLSGGDPGPETGLATALAVLLALMVTGIGVNPSSHCELGPIGDHRPANARHSRAAQPLTGMAVSRPDL